MGTNRLVTFCFSICAVIGTDGFLDAQTRSAGQANYQTISGPRNSQVGRVAFQEPETPDWMKKNRAVHQAFNDQANELLAEQEAADRFVREQKTSHPHFLQRPKHMRSVGFRNVGTQDDPFGENQNKTNGQFDQAPGGANQFDPFADPPQTEAPAFSGPGQNQKPNALPGTQTPTPVTETPQLEPDIVPPLQLESRIPLPGVEQEEKQLAPPQDQLTNPFADPPSQVPGQPDTTLPGQNNDPTQNTETDKPEQNQLTDPFKDPPAVDTGVEYHHGTTLREKYVPPAGVYTPPIVQPNYGSMPGYEVQPIPQVYQPAYQPIPGYAPPQNFPPNPMVPSPTRPAIVTAPSIVSAPPICPSAGGNVYSPVVAGGCDACGNECSANSCRSSRVGCPNFYFSANVGWTGLRDLQSHSGLGEFQADSGTGFGFAMGRRNGRNLRTELEFSFRDNDITGFDDGITVMPLVGEMTSFSGMANAYWELVDVRSCNLKPYFGGGVGFISIDSEIGTSPTQSILQPGTDNDTSFAFQYMVGVNYKAFPNVDLFAEYRMLKADAMRLDTTTGNSDRYDYHTDNIFMGLRWKF